jgi:membrane-associated phospholipid phosphatase
MRPTKPVLAALTLVTLLTAQVDVARACISQHAWTGAEPLPASAGSRSLALLDLSAADYGSEAGQTSQDGGKKKPLSRALSVLGEDGWYLVAFPKRKTPKGVATASAILGGVGLLIVFDDEIRQWAQENRTDTTDQWESRIEPLGRGDVTFFGSAATYAFGALAHRPKVSETGRTLLEALLFNEAFVKLGKGIFGREAPGDDARASNFFTDFPGVFPSGHTARAFTVAAVLAEQYGHTAAWLGYPLASLVGLARIESDAHWASDVLAGAALGYGVGKAIAWQRAKRAQRRPGSPEALLVPMFSPRRGEAGVMLRITL